MLDRPIEQLTLRDLFIEAERMTHELIEHVDQNFIPKVHRLGKLARDGLDEHSLEDVRDLTIRNRASDLLHSENFTGPLYDKSEKYFTAIDAAVNRILDQ